MDGWMDGWRDGLRDGWMDGWMDEAGQCDRAGGVHMYMLLYSE